MRITSRAVLRASVAAQVVVPLPGLPPDAVHATDDGPGGARRPPSPSVLLGPSQPRRTHCRRRGFCRRLGLSGLMVAALITPPLSSIILIDYRVTTVVWQS